MKTAVIIPARLGSRRFPRKVLARDTGKYLVEHVHERVVGCPGVNDVFVATDSAEVFDACRSFGARGVMTSAEHASGTDRVAEVARGLDHDVVINVQGDEPLIAHEDIHTLVKLLEEGDPGTSGARGEQVLMGTLVARRTDREGFEDPNIVKAVVDPRGWALYFSRSPVPYPPLSQAPQLPFPGKPVRGACGAGESRSPAAGEEGPEWFQHIGIYAYRREFLLALSTLPPTPLERRERLEQLRVLENGYRIRVGLSTSRHLGIDTQEEYAAFVAEYRSGLLK